MSIELRGKRIGKNTLDMREQHVQRPWGRKVLEISTKLEEGQ